MLAEVLQDESIVELTNLMFGDPDYDMNKVDA